MFKFLYKIYYNFSSPFGESKLIDRFLLKFYNVILPFYFKYYYNKPNLITNSEPIYIVSLTTFPNRIDKVWLVIETLFHQTIKPDKIVLWLYNGEFPDEQQLPLQLLKLKKRGLEILFCDENLMPHKKYFHTIQSYPNANVITVDDDVFYDPTLVEKLIKANKQYPNSVCCTIARKIAIDNNLLMPYNYWYYAFSSMGPNFHLLPIGVGGVLYPPNSINQRAFIIDELKLNALRADDLWLKIMATLNKVQSVVISSEFERFPIPIFQSDDTSLMSENVVLNNNDRIINELLVQFNLNPQVFKPINIIKT